jgi:hypothetical protein
MSQLRYAVNAADISIQTTGLMQVNVTTLTDLADMRRFRLIGTSGPNDAGVFQGKLLDSQGQTLGTTFPPEAPIIGPPSTHGAIAVFPQPGGELLRLNAGSFLAGWPDNDGDNDANPPTVYFGGVTYAMYLGTVDGTPSTIPSTWFNLVMELRIQGKVDQQINIAGLNGTTLLEPPGFVNTTNFLGAFFVAHISGNGQCLIRIPITVTLV